MDERRDVRRQVEYIGEGKWKVEQEKGEGWGIQGKFRKGRAGRAKYGNGKS